jgi:hypothetical protein
MAEKVDDGRGEPSAFALRASADKLVFALNPALAGLNNQ